MLIILSSAKTFSGSGSGSRLDWSPLPGSSLGPCPKLIYENIKNSVSARTWQDYETSWKNWVLFCNVYDAIPYQPYPILLLSYLASLMERNLVPRSNRL